MDFVPSIATNPNDLKSRITAAVNSLDEDTPNGVWDEFGYCLDDVREAGGGHIEHYKMVEGNYRPAINSEWS